MLGSQTTRAVRGVLALCAIGFAVGFALIAPLPAAPAGACWKTVLNDWYDNGRIDGTYPKPCYRAAIAHLPVDAKLYSNAETDITASLRNRVLSSSHSRTVRGPVHRALDKVSPPNATSPPIAVLAVASAALLLIGVGVWQAVKRRG